MSPVTVAMQTPSVITGSTLTQTPTDPGVLADYTLTFTLEMPVPKTATIQLTAPVGVSFYQDSTACSVTTNIFRNDVCRIVGSTVI